MQVQTLRLYHQVIQLNYSDAYIIKRKERNKNVRYIYGKKNIKYKQRVTL